MSYINNLFLFFNKKLKIVKLVSDFVQKLDKRQDLADILAFHTLYSSDSSLEPFKFNKNSTFVIFLTNFYTL